MWGMELSLKGAEFSKVIGTGIQEEIEDSRLASEEGWGEGLIVDPLGGWLNGLEECTRWEKTRDGIRGTWEKKNVKGVIKRKKSSFLLA